MDTLPVEVIAKILGYLPADDVCHLQFLNRRFKQATERYRKHLEFPKVTVEIEEYDKTFTNSDDDMIFVLFKGGSHSFDALYKTANLTTCEGGRDEKNFFASWHRQGVKDDLRAYFCWLFQKGDVVLNVKYHLNAEVETALKEAIEAANTRFVEVTLSLQDLQLSNRSLETPLQPIPPFIFAAAQRARNEVLKMPLTIALEDVNISSALLDQLVALNFFVTLMVSDLCTAVKVVVEYWENNPDALNWKFNFQFSVKYNASTCYSCPVSHLPEKFHFSTMTQECMKPTARTKAFLNVSLEGRPQILQLLFSPCSSRILVNFHVVNPV